MTEMSPAEEAWLRYVNAAWTESMGSPDSLGTRMKWFLAGYEEAQLRAPLTQ